MDYQFHKSASYVPPGGYKADMKRRQEQWDEYQKQQQDQTTPTSDNQAVKTRKRADSHQPTSSAATPQYSMGRAHDEQLHTTVMHTRSRSSYEADLGRRHSNEANYNLLLPQASPAGELRRLSGNFNAPTHIELERDREHKKSLKGVERLRSKVKGWVKT